jgi:hypothetical protein
MKFYGLEKEVLVKRSTFAGLSLFSKISFYIQSQVTPVLSPFSKITFYIQSQVTPRTQ